MSLINALFRRARARLLAGPVALCLVATPAWAGDALPVLELQFTTSSVVVLPTEAVPLWVTLSVSEAPLAFDTSASEAPFGLMPAQLPATGSNFSLGLFDEPFGSYTSIGLYTFRVCNDEVSTVCTPLIYTYDVPSDPATWFEIEQPFELAAGDSRDFLLYSLLPVDGAAAAGSYRIFNVGVGLTVFGYAEDGVTPLEAEVFSSRTCAGGAGDCAFTITVVPEPRTAWLLLAGIVPVWMRLRRR